MRVLVSAAGCVAAIWSAPAPAPVVPAVAERFGLARRLDGVHDRVALTFDDGPDPSGTPVILEILARRDAKATFFCVGEQVERSPSLLREIADAGHAVAIHGYRHRCQLGLGPRAVASDLDRATEVTGEALSGPAQSAGFQRLYRPPYGIFSAAGLAAARRRGLRPVLWSRWGHDWRGRAFTSGRRIAAELCDGLVGGDILLLHDSDRYNARHSWRRTAQALPGVLDAIEDRGLTTTGLPPA